MDCDETQDLLHGYLDDELDVVSSRALTQHLQACSTPTVIGLRAVLSWATPPSTTNPDELNFWGNRIDTHVQLRPARGGEGLSDLIYRVGSVALDQISNSTSNSGREGEAMSRETESEDQSWQSGELANKRNIIDALCFQTTPGTSNTLLSHGW